MALRRTGLAALAVSSVAAFKDTSPLFLFSDSDLLLPGFDRHQVSQSDVVEDTIANVLETCSSTDYVIVSQPGVSASDFASSKSAPHLRRWMSGQEKRIASTGTVPEVFGSIDTAKLETSLSKCDVEVINVDGSSGKIPLTSTSNKHLLKLTFPTLPTTSSRAFALQDNDSFLNAVLQTLSNSTTIIYTTTPPTASQSDALTTQQHQQQQHAAQIYEMDHSQEPVHMDLKRDVSARADNNGTDQTHLPLFDKYQFLNAGIFMGGVVSLILFLILYVGISAVAGLEVSYFAFSKEMGPAAQKKQQ